MTIHAGSFLLGAAVAWAVPLGALGLLVAFDSWQTRRWRARRPTQVDERDPIESYPTTPPAAGSLITTEAGNRAMWAIRRGQQS